MSAGFINKGPLYADASNEILDRVMKFLSYANPTQLVADKIVSSAVSAYDYYKKFNDPSVQMDRQYTNFISNGIYELTKPINQSLQEQGADWQKNPGNALATGMIGFFTIPAMIIAAGTVPQWGPVAAQWGSNAATESRSRDIGWGAFQGLSSYGLTTPIDKWNWKDAGISTGIGMLVGLGGNYISSQNVIMGINIVNPTSKAVAMGGSSGFGNLLTQKVLGKEWSGNNGVDWLSVGWAATMGWGGSYTGSWLLNPIAAWYGSRAAWTIPEFAGGWMLNEFNNKRQKNKK